MVDRAVVELYRDLVLATGSVLPGSESLLLNRVIPVLGEGT